jgi:Ca-activated chloride channel family protein
MPLKVEKFVKSVAFLLCSRRKTPRIPRISQLQKRVEHLPLLVFFGCILGLDMQAAMRTVQSIRVDVSLVTVPVIVTGKQGEFVSGLRRSDFRIFENSVEQSIDSLVPGAEPFHVVLMIDTSGSTKFRLEQMQKAAIAFVDALRPQDRILVASFDREVRLAPGFSQDRDAIRQSILDARPTAGQTLLYDALWKVMNERLHGVSGRKAIVLFTDGIDNESLQASPSEISASLERSDVIVYAVQYDTRSDGMSDRYQVPVPAGYPSLSTLYNRAVKFLKNLCGRSGGRLFQPASVENLAQAFHQVAEDLRNQYTLCYYPTNQKRDGSYRRIRVMANNPGGTIRTRPGYRAEK